VDSPRRDAAVTAFDGFGDAEMHFDIAHWQTVENRTRASGANKGNEATIQPGATMMKTMVIASAMALTTAAAGTANAQEALAKSSGCMACHATDTKKVGPSFKETAAKFKGKADAEATLLTTFKAAKGHAAVKTSDADVKSLLKWILAM
jgi:cytochrome c